jgi:F0F1-type ATP synthase membrane subunit b/b'
MIRLLYSLIPMALMVLLAITAFALTKLSKRIPEYEAEIAKNMEAASAEAAPAEEVEVSSEKVEETPAEVTEQGYTVIRK